MAQKVLMQTSLRLSFTVYKPEVPPSPKTTPIVVLHGLFGSKTNWNSTCKKLSTNLKLKRDIIAIDLRNHGDSPNLNDHNYDLMTEDLKGFIEIEKFGDKVSFLGHSMGGKVAMRYALLFPEKVQHLIVVDIAPVKYQRVKWVEHILTTLTKIKLPQNVDRATARNIVEKQLKSKIKSKETREFLLMNLISAPNGSYKWKCNYKVLQQNVHKVIDFPELKGKFEKPVLFIAGSESDYVTKEEEPSIKAHFPNYNLIYIEGAGHNVHTEKPKEFIEFCTKYLDGT
ncbi:sn-1-specific diacylglycerol lipase ABHD11-like [Onthophagus taurus]|uniref:sn-1-specific diacylglycerol lipase ABHD11-like n=1 Tax=Onthophagus taurus TaxID=166361 RepID=UPI0039BE505A